MSGFENYHRELAELDHEIIHYAAVCGVDRRPVAHVDACMADSHESWAADKPRQTLRGLLILRIKLETEMLEQSITPHRLGGE
jgi:hypothetical protein